MSIVRHPEPAPIDVPWDFPDECDGYPLRYERDAGRLYSQRLIPHADYARVINMSLWRWADSEMQRGTTSVKVLRRDVMNILFGSMPYIKTSTVGRFISAAIKYRVKARVENEQMTGWCWQFYHIADLRYGMEVQILRWLPWFLVNVARSDSQADVTTERLLEELDMVRSGLDIESIYGVEAEE